jgi:hypothetical protein
MQFFIPGKNREVLRREDGIDGGMPQKRKNTGASSSIKKNTQGTHNKATGTNKKPKPPKPLNNLGPRQNALFRPFPRQSQSPSPPRNGLGPRNNAIFREPRQSPSPPSPPSPTKNTQGTHNKATGSKPKPPNNLVRQYALFRY